MIFPDYSLYLCTDKELMSSATLEESVTDAILGGVTCVQLREKNCSSLQFYNEAKTIQEITQAHHVPLIINDRLDIALAVNADGLHVGQDDLPAHKARELLGPNKILGVSVRTSKEAIAAEKAGADYLGVGAMFSTSTKTDAQIVSKEGNEKLLSEVVSLLDSAARENVISKNCASRNQSALASKLNAIKA